MNGRQAVRCWAQSWRGYDHQIHLWQTVNVGVLDRADGGGRVKTRTVAGPEGADVVIGHPEPQGALFNLKRNRNGILGIGHVPYALNGLGFGDCPLHDAAGTGFRRPNEFLLGTA